MDYDEIERSLGVGSQRNERVIDAEVVSPKRLKVITIASMIMSMSAVATATWFAAKETTIEPGHATDPSVASITLLDDLVRQDAITTLELAIDERDETYKALFLASQDRIQQIEMRSRQLETALAALLPVIGSTVAMTTAASITTVAPQPVAPRTPPQALTPTATTVRPIPPPVATAPVPRPPQAVFTPLPAGSPQLPIVDETALPFVVISQDESGITLHSDTELKDGSGNMIRIGQQAPNIEGRILRISPEEKLVITDKRIYVFD